MGPARLILGVLAFCAATSCILKEVEHCPDKYSLEPHPDCGWYWCQKHPNDPVCKDGGGSPDACAGECSSDAGSDASISCSTNDDCTSAERPLCNEANVCSTCASNEACLRFANTPACGPSGTCVECTADSAGLCSGSSPVCAAEGTTCVACNEDADCSAPATAHCDIASHACQPCSDSTQCASRGDGLHVCSAGSCVQCTPGTEEAACGDNSCDPATNNCTGTRRASVNICGECVADSECRADHRCIPLYFGPDEEPQGGHCMKIATTGCIEPFSAAPIQRVSLSGAASAPYCGITESRTSCDAINALERSATCPGGDAAACDAAGARCEAVNFTANRCTYQCTASAECPVTFPCNGPDGSKYCGSPP